MVTKTKIVSPSSYTRRTNLWVGYWYPYSSSIVNLSKGAQYVQSQSNPYRSIGRGFDVGGPFQSQKYEIFADLEPRWFEGGNEQTYTALYPNEHIRSACQGLAAGSSADAVIGACQRFAPILVKGSTLDSRGATAVSLVKPTNPVFDGATAVAELISERKLFSVPGRNGSMSGEYLNYQLGVSPAIGAITDFREAAKNSEKILDQLHRDSGKPIRRRFSFPPVVSSSSSETVTYPYSDYGASAYYMEQGRLSVSERTEQRMWFSGAFTYYLPKEVGMARKIAELEAVYGVKPGIDTAWELIPFSFVADYFANVGDVLSNINSFASDGLVMQYGYMMCNTKYTYNATWEGRILYGGSWRPETITATLVAETMQRQRANPFGFGLLDSDLSPRQLSILAALGLNRR